MEKRTCDLFSSVTLQGHLLIAVALSLDKLNDSMLLEVLTDES